MAADIGGDWGAAQAHADIQAKKRAIRLSAAVALAGGNASVVFATGSILGAAMAPRPDLATAPLSVFVIGMACGTLPIGALARRYGRRAALMTGAGCGVLCGLIAALSSLFWSFGLYCVAVFFGGIYAAAAQSYRFAATDGASPALAPKLISWVMMGGVFAGVLGPQLVQFTAQLSPHYMFAATYLGQAIVAMLAGLVLWGVQSAPEPIVAARAPARPLSEIARSPQFVVAVICGTVGYGVMNMLMTSAPLAMQMCGLSLSDSTLGIQWHVLAMYIPSFFTASLIARFGASRIVACGLALELAAALIDLSGLGVAHFWAGLIALGVGWNFAFVGASAMIVACHAPHERTKVQSLNDFIIFGTMAAGSFSSGHVLAHGGWSAVNILAIAATSVGVAAIAWRIVAERR